jgi:hypothetical protein
VSVSGWKSWLVLLVALLLTAGCGGSGKPAAVDKPTSPLAPSASASLVTKPCPVGATTLSLRGRHGARVAGYAIGSGRDAVILEHGSGRGYGACDGWSFGTWLAATQHVRVVLVTRCPYAGTTCPSPVETGARLMATVTQPAVDHLRRHGARRVTLVGASAGAADVIQAGGVVQGVDAVVALSPDVTDTGGPIRAGADRVPTLIAFGTDDRYTVERVTRRWYRAVPGRPKRLVVFPHSQVHGWNTVLDEDGEATDFADVVAGWVHGHYR